MRSIPFIIMVLLLLNSCGTILDSTRIVGKWSLASAEFYTYNEELDSYKKISGVDATSDSTSPVNGAFFGTNNIKYIITFQTETFDVLHSWDTSTNVGIPFVSSNKWSVDSTDNSITFDVISTNPSSDSIWQKGFKIKNYWPLSNPTTLEITLIASDVNMSYFDIPVGTSSIHAVKMKGIFTKLQ
jgi:hypothetical protein